MIIGRQREIEMLWECYESDEAELVALYGRRRVGKTYLVDQVFKDRITFSHRSAFSDPGRQNIPKQRPVTDSCNQVQMTFEKRNAVPCL